MEEEKKESSEEFKIEEAPVEVIPGEEEKEPEEPISLEAVEAVNEAMIRTVCLVVSKVATSITKIPELAFDEEEINQLVLLWKPLIPSLSPVALAAVGTTIIIGGKTALYFSLRKKKVSGTEPSKAVEEEVKSA